MRMQDDARRHRRRRYARGRLLLISTTNLDLQRPVVWNIGAITGQRTARSLVLFQEKILLASASVPSTFPPVLVDVDTMGALPGCARDGGAAAQVFSSHPRSTCVA